MSITCQQVNYRDPQQAADLLMLLNNYAIDPMGGATPLNADTHKNLAEKLAELPYALSIIAYSDQQAVGLANCFFGFSTFKCQPLINIHDFAVNPEFRGQGIGKKLLQAIEIIAREKNCCKITLEVLEGNIAAQQLYKKFGFAGYELDPAMGRAMFWEKSLATMPQ